MRVFRLSFFYKIVRYFVYSIRNGVKQMNSEIRIKQLEERVAYLETIAQSSAHEILTAYIHDVAERYGIPCAKGYNRNRTMLVSSNFEIQCKKTISMALGISKISNISHDMLSDARYIVNAIVAVYARRHN